MPKVQVYISEELRRQLEDKGVHATVVCKDALESAVLDDNGQSPKILVSEIKKRLRFLEELAGG